MKAFSILCTSALFSATFTQAKVNINGEEFLNKAEVEKLIEESIAQHETIKHLKSNDDIFNEGFIKLEAQVASNSNAIKTNQENILRNTVGVRTNEHSVN